MTKKFYMLLFAVLMTAGLASAQQVVIRVAPPRPEHVGRIGRAPGPGFVWIEGYHEWRGNAYVWVPGRWERPPRPRARWVRPHYRHVRGGWIFVAGHWR
ncbi:MAG TPA: YXWGXW repeat-containing protein [Terriglobia bacterium]|nr:YXWGXW repeat-containing protein [Terriglobia bacterium]